MSGGDDGVEEVAAAFVALMRAVDDETTLITEEEINDRLDRLLANPPTPGGDG